MQIRDTTVVLTGATGGIGSSLAYAFAVAGARLILVGRNTAQLDALCRELPTQTLPHLFVAADLLTDAGRQRLAGACAGLSIDMLVNNAGASEFNLLENSSASAITTLVNLNLTVPMLLTQLLLPQLQQQKSAAVINVGSAFGSIGYPGFSAYCASKFGLRGFSEALRRELADTPVRVLHVAPRATQTTMNSNRVVAMNEALGNAMDDPKVVAAFVLNRIRNGRWGSCVIGWPERLYAFINGIFPTLTDRTLRAQLPIIKDFLGSNAATSTNPSPTNPTNSNQSSMGETI
ncbi:MAG: SDR family oxidoreductase [Gammaproteobacteria bacterium]|nr:SDR family oxidoreductase [Gammaproteobacteria bacterium]MDP2140598.1 SDR family oxidoreductase [Gammaproteobacteria bacterium]MDP2347370.1 SDR family oxidoreductase [Gammaproteobacteria bacterium]